MPLAWEKHAVLELLSLWHTLREDDVQHTSGCARDTGRGQEAVAKLQEEGLRALFHQLDIDDLQSIRALRDFLKEKYGGLNVLVNNAGIAFKVKDTTPFAVQAEVTLKTNFFGTRNVCNELLPLVKPYGRVVNVSSMVINSALKGCSQELQQKFHSDTITEDELVKLMTKFVEDTKKNVHEKEGWPNTAYGVSKIGVTVLSKIQARMLNEKRKGQINYKFESFTKDVLQILISSPFTVLGLC
ncbi:carbonyl reductase [NADPH] 1 [Patagioenas fasciata monilis]|uniref:Carbonyl reductase [NADPH] 1 n=1 Tax=Patagioenas fasciata monilis TaxID=372326 RepID=A0A1V4J2Q2_PATFA|nr:carbonyl reductase [NADPH] 1 [Patagioenas fasciata monilis]